MLLSVDIDDQEFHGIEDEKHSRTAFKQILLQLKEGTFAQLNLKAENAGKSSKTKVKGGDKPLAKSNEIVLDSSDSENEVHVAPLSGSSRGRSVSHPDTYAEDENEILTSEEEYAPQPVKARATGGGGGRRRKGRDKK